MTKKLFTGLALIAIGIWACTEDIVEKSLKNASVEMLSPANNFVSTSNAINFWWEETDGASKYQLQVVSPSFSAIQALHLDTSLTNTKFTFAFLPGNYQGRIKALNNSSESDYTYFTFSVDTALDLTEQIVTLVSPEDNFETNATTILFKWNKIAFADDYRFELLNSLGSVIDVKTPLLTDTISYTISSEGTYQWRVQAHSNNGTSSMYSTRTLIIDRTAPPVSALNLPIDNDTTSIPVLLQWTREASAYQDSVFIATDTLFTNIVRQDLTLNTSYSYNADTTSGVVKYFWKLRTADKAGNWSVNYSQTRRFRVN